MKVGPPIRPCAGRAVIVSGDVHLTALADRIPVRRPAEFLAEIEQDQQPSSLPASS